MSGADADRFRIDWGFLSTSTMTAIMNRNSTYDDEATILNENRCIVYANFDHDVPVLILCLLSLICGFVYSFFGYRFYKASLFLTGFLFGSVLIYMVCEKEALLPKLGNAGVSVIAGVLFGLITMLVQYVGLFMTGFLCGLLYGVLILLTWTFISTPDTLWITVGVLFSVGLIFALLALKFQRVFMIVCSSTIGSALIVPSLDYVVEKFAAVQLFLYTLNVTKPVVWNNLCWYSWLILSVWPILFVAACMIQWKLTSVGYDHKEGCRNFRRRPPPTSTIVVHRTINSNNNNNKDRSRRFASSSSMSNVVNSTKNECQKCSSPTMKGYRYLYQTRRMHGDIICQSYIESLQRLSQKQSTPNDTLPTMTTDRTHLTMLTADSSRSDPYSGSI